MYPVSQLHHDSSSTGLVCDQTVELPEEVSVELFTRLLRSQRAAAEEDLVSRRQKEALQRHKTHEEEVSRTETSLNILISVIPGLLEILTLHSITLVL